MAPWPHSTYCRCPNCGNVHDYGHVYVTTTTYTMTPVYAATSGVTIGVDYAYGFGRRVSTRDSARPKVGGRRAAPAMLDVAAVPHVEVAKPWLEPPTPNRFGVARLRRSTRREVLPLRSRPGSAANAA